MSSSEQQLVTRLLATSAVTDLVVARLYAVGECPQSPTLPYLIYQTVSENSVDGSTGPSGTKNDRIQIDSYAATYSAMKTLKAAVYDALAGWSSTGGTPVIDMCQFEGGRDMPEPADPGEQEGVQRYSQDFELGYSDT